ncbi:lachesin-like isoform X2 [Artemia franciscana]|uniref:Ig-like domain-containing protein n=1 Tax=Artemia franciscana TaxID=6661 RepID=A0AA88HBN5_ARTSF|nr:hypothetical protein QYM36_014162 [Artemia franciscana]
MFTSSSEMTSDTMLMVPFVILLLVDLTLVKCSIMAGTKRKHRSSDDNARENSVFVLPTFEEQVPNVTVSVGRDASLPCVVDNLGNYKVAWVRADTQTILTIHSKTISRNPRISLAHGSHRHWFLKIKSVDESDRGWYMCQINTDPIRSSLGYLEVKVPPKILPGETGAETAVREGMNATLICKAHGQPEPKISWKREDNTAFMYNGVPVTSIDGESLTIQKVSRLHMGAFLCIASNGVPPMVSQRMVLKVQFPPMVMVPSQLEGVPLGREVILECHVEAYPKAILYWTNGRGDMIISSDRYEIIQIEDMYTIFMRLKIRNITNRDFGTYRCVARNSLGESDGAIKLYEIILPTQPSTTKDFVTAEVTFHEVSKGQDESIEKKSKRKKWKEGKTNPGRNRKENVIDMIYEEDLTTKIEYGWLGNISSDGRKLSLTRGFHVILYASLRLYFQCLL